MNAEFPHLTLPELAASESSGLQAAASAAHLETCAACKARSRDLAADGVRFLVSRCEPPPGLVSRVLETTGPQPARPRRGYLARPLRIAAAGLTAAVLAGFIAAQVIAPSRTRLAGMITVKELAYRAAATALRQCGLSSHPIGRALAKA